MTVSQDRHQPLYCCRSDDSIETTTVYAFGCNPKCRSFSFRQSLSGDNSR
ncbi:MAG: hypothetical protein ACFKPT_20610 [Gloeotrichia echinulata GP01]|nr:hypothetical protein [Gloeotrichia echinulata DEX184]